VSASVSPAAATPPRLEIDFGRIAQDLQIRKTQVEHAIQLLEEGYAVPFIALYRRERVGGLTAEQLRQVERRWQMQKQLAERKQTILRNIQTLGRLTDELRQQILHADTPRRLEDLYLPFKPRKKSFAQVARDKGLEPLAQSLWAADPAVANFNDLLPTFVNPDRGLASPDEVLAHVKQLLAEILGETAIARETARRYLWEHAKLVTAKAEGASEAVAAEFKDYHQFSDTPRHLAPHRVLAINRGEKAKALKVRLDFPLPPLLDLLRERLKLADHPHHDLLQDCLQTAVTGVLVPALEKELRRELTEKAEDHAIHLVARNLRRLLMQPPVKTGKILAIHPAHKGGCRLAVLDEHGLAIDHRSMHLVELTERTGKKGKASASPGAAPAEATGPATTDTTPASPEVPESASAPESVPSAASGPSNGQPTPENTSAESKLPTPDSGPPATATTATVPLPAPSASDTPSAASSSSAEMRRAEAKQQLAAWITQHGCSTIALGQGLGFRELEEFLGELIAEHLPQARWHVVSEAGLSQYIVSSTAREELPNFDPATRGAIALGRRLRDPLAEFVKVDPLALSVGLHHYELPEKRLREALLAEVEDCINLVGVDINTASVAQLRYVAGLNPVLALAAVQHRQQHGPFRSRADFSKIADWTPMVCQQAAGSLRVVGEEPLDRTPLHPEDYASFRHLLALAGVTLDDLMHAERRSAVLDKLATVAREATTAAACGCSPAHVNELVNFAARIGVDPRDSEPKPLAKTRLLRLEDLQPGQQLQGVVQNVVDFGAFIDIGLKDSGLVHISQLANRFIKSPYDLVAVGDVVTVWVINIDQNRKRVSLTMIPPGTERKAPERKPPPREKRDTPPPRPAESSSGKPAKAKLFAPQVATPNQKAPPMQPPPRPAASERPQRGAGGAAPTPRPPAPPRKVRTKPPPKLSTEALQGTAPLRTFGELKALYDAKRTQAEPPSPSPPEASPPADAGGN
jgi:transcriptional accessory protein Tex/SPT6